MRRKSICARLRVRQPKSVPNEAKSLSVNEVNEEIEING